MRTVTELESLYRELVTKEIELRLQFDDLNARTMISGEVKSDTGWRSKASTTASGTGTERMGGFSCPKGRAILGIDTDEEFLTIEKWFDVILREDLDKFVISLNKYITEPQNKHFQIEYRIKTADDEIRWIRTRGMAIWDEDGNPIRVAGSITDITEQKLADEKIHRLPSSIH